MRIVAGRLGGRRLRAPAGDATRPTAERVREALFSILADVHGCEVLDLFAGSGALGIEALSRGAARAVFVERDRAALAALRGNLSELSLREPQAQVIAGDFSHALRGARERGETYDLVFIDPPYTKAHACERELADGLSAVLKPSARVIVESDRRHPLALALELQLERRYGDTLIRIHKQS